MMSASESNARTSQPDAGSLCRRVSAARRRATTSSRDHAARYSLNTDLLQASQEFALAQGQVGEGHNTVTAALEGTGGEVRAEARQDPAAPHRMTLPLPAIEPGAYTVRLTIRDAGGKRCSQWTQSVTAHGGPLY